MGPSPLFPVLGHSHGFNDKKGSKSENEELVQPAEETMNGGATVQGAPSEEEEDHDVSVQVVRE